MRRISFNLTQEQVRNRTKTVTRRLGWKNVKVGEMLLGVDRLRSKDAKTLAIIEVTSVRFEPLDRITAADVVREGYPMLTTSAPDLGTIEAPITTVTTFVGKFCKAMKCAPDREVTRIEFRYVEDTELLHRALRRSLGVAPRLTREATA